MSRAVRMLLRAHSSRSRSGPRRARRPRRSGRRSQSGRRRRSPRSSTAARTGSGSRPASGKIFRRVGGTFQQEQAELGASSSATSSSSRGGERRPRGRHQRRGRAAAPTAATLGAGRRAAAGGEPADARRVRRPSSRSATSTRSASTATARAWLAGAGSQICARRARHGRRVGTRLGGRQRGAGDDCKIDARHRRHVLRPGAATSATSSREVVRRRVLLLQRTRLVTATHEGRQRRQRLRPHPPPRRRPREPEPAVGRHAGRRRHLVPPAHGDGWTRRADWTIANPTGARSSTALRRRLRRRHGPRGRRGGHDPALDRRRELLLRRRRRRLTTRTGARVCLADGANGAVGGANGKLARHDAGERAAGHRQADRHDRRPGDASRRASPSPSRSTRPTRAAPASTPRRSRGRRPACPRDRQPGDVHVPEPRLRHGHGDVRRQRRQRRRGDGDITIAKARRAGAARVLHRPGQQAVGARSSASASA